MQAQGRRPQASRPRVSASGIRLVWCESRAYGDHGQKVAQNELLEYSWGGGWFFWGLWLHWGVWRGWGARLGWGESRAHGYQGRKVAQNELLECSLGKPWILWLRKMALEQWKYDA